MRQGVCLIECVRVIYTISIHSYREHYQWNMDIWGSSTLQVEAELLSVLIATFKSLGLTAHDVVIKVCIGCVVNISYVY